MIDCGPRRHLEMPDVTGLAAAQSLSLREVLAGRQREPSPAYLRKMQT